MSVKPVVAGRPVVHFVLLIAALAGLLLMAGALDAAFAQGGPFGAPRAQAPAPPMGGVLGWIFAKQAEFYRQFSSLIRAAKADGSVAWGLFGSVVPLRHLSRRRTRSWQGGDLVLHGRE